MDMLMRPNWDTWLLLIIFFSRPFIGEQMVSVGEKNHT